jgi:hypothetical protein
VEAILGAGGGRDGVGGGGKEGFAANHGAGDGLHYSGIVGDAGVNHADDHALPEISCVLQYVGPDNRVIEGKVRRRSRRLTDRVRQVNHPSASLIHPRRCRTPAQAWRLRNADLDVLNYFEISHSTQSKGYPC